MGCCVSTEENKATQNQNQKQCSSPHQQQFPCISKSPPRPEEETVKEVLSETPKPRPKPKPEPEPEPRITKSEVLKLEKVVVQEQQQEDEPTKPKVEFTPKKPSFKEIEVSLKDPLVCSTTTEEISDVVSEMCSLSESISTSTLHEDHELQNYTTSEVVRQRVFKPQGYNGNFSHTHQQKNRAFSGGRSPARRADPSPPRRRNAGPGPGSRREPGENSGRRSRSPATRSNNNVGRSPSARRTGPSPGRVRMVQAPDRDVGERKVEQLHNRNGNGNENRNRNGNGNGNEEGEWQGPSESLENPLVSLECFIFL